MVPTGAPGPPRLAWSAALCLVRRTLRDTHEFDVPEALRARSLRVTHSFGRLNVVLVAFLRVTHRFDQLDVDPVALMCHTQTGAPRGVSDSLRLRGSAPRLRAAPSVSAGRLRLGCHDGGRQRIQ